MKSCWQAIRGSSMPFVDNSNREETMNNPIASQILQTAEQALVSVTNEPTQAVELLKASRRQLDAQVEQVRALPDDPDKGPLLKIADEAAAFFDFSMMAVDRPDAAARMAGSIELLRLTVGQSS